MNDNIKFIDRHELVSSTPEIETDVIEIIKNNLNFIVINVYRPPKTIIESFIDILNQYLNINMPNKQAIQFLETLLQFSLLPSINIPTRITNSSETIIDNIFTNNTTNFYSGTILSDISDHLPIFISQSIQNHRTIKKYIFITLLLKTFSIYLKLCTSKIGFISSPFKILI